MVLATSTTVPIVIAVVAIVLSLIGIIVLVSRDRRSATNKYDDNNKKIFTFYAGSSAATMEKVLAVRATNMVQAQRLFFETQGIPALLHKVRDEFGDSAEVAIDVEGKLLSFSIVNAGEHLANLEGQVKHLGEDILELIYLLMEIKGGEAERLDQLLKVLKVNTSDTGVDAPVE